MHARKGAISPGILKRTKGGHAQGMAPQLLFAMFLGWALYYGMTSEHAEEWEWDSDSD